jgi:hypothetical protein
MSQFPSVFGNILTQGNLQNSHPIPQTNYAQAGQEKSNGFFNDQQSN